MNIAILRFIAIPTALTLCSTSTLAVIKQNDAYPEDYTSVTAMFDHTVDGDRKTARLDTPRDLLLSLDKNHLLLFDNNGYGLRLVDKNGSVKTTKVELGLYPKEDLKVYKSGNILFADPVRDIIIQVTPDYRPYLFAGKRYTVAQQDSSLFKNLLEDETDIPQSISLSDAEFNVPLSITPIGEKGWILIDSMFDNVLRYIDKKGTITKVTGLDDLTKSERMLSIRNHKGLLYLLGEQNVYAIDFDAQNKTAKIISHWNNNTVANTPQFYQLTGIAFDDNQIVVVDAESGKILELHPNNKTKVLYQIQCSSFTYYKTPLCKLEDSEDDTIYTSYGDIIKNPWDDGYIISDSAMNVLYQFKEGRLSLFTGQLDKADYLNHPVLNYTDKGD